MVAIGLASEFTTPTIANTIDEPPFEAYAVTCGITQSASDTRGVMVMCRALR